MKIDPSPPIIDELNAKLARHSEMAMNRNGEFSALWREIEKLANVVDSGVIGGTHV